MNHTKFISAQRAITPCSNFHQISGATGTEIKVQGNYFETFVSLQPHAVALLQ